MRRIAAVLLRSFLQGLALLSPICITAYILYSIFVNVDSLVPFVPPGIGFFIVIFLVTIIGYAGTRFFAGKWVFDSFAALMEQTPGVKYVYSSIRDLVNSFMGDKKRFNKAVWVCVGLNPDIWRIGFMTQGDMGYLGMHGKVAVYMPHAYAISGWVIVTDIANVIEIKDMSAGQAMKFAVSGGITTVEDDGKSAKEN